MRTIVAAAVLSLGAIVTTEAGQPATAVMTAGQGGGGAVQGVVTQARPRMAVESKVTKGAPYSAEAISEHVQVLADGNRIVQKNVTRTYRDSEGRTRREQVRTLADGTETSSISITDPVAGTSFILDPEARTAYRSNMVVASALRSGAAGGGFGGAVARQSEPAPSRIPQSNPNTSTETLGQRTIEGVVADGTRTTIVVPAGAIGNEQPITIVAEQWFSPELQVLVLTRHVDPRGGETVYRLTNIVRGEQDRSLFEVPADYTIKEPGVAPPVRRFDR